MKIEEKEFVDDQIRSLNRDSVKFWEDDLEENFTINFMLDRPDWKREYEKLTHEFFEDQESLYVYPFEQLHMTLLGRVDIKMDENRILDVVENRMKGREFKFEVGYLACNEMGVSIISEPKFDLGLLRNEIREDLGVKGDDYTKYLSIYERLAWFNFIRFKSKPSEGFFESLWNNRNYQLGEFVAKDISILKNTSRTLDPKKSIEVAKVVF